MLHVQGLNGAFQPEDELLPKLLYFTEFHFHLILNLSDAFLA